MRTLVRFVGGPWDGRREPLVSRPARLMVPTSLGKVRIWRRDRTVPGRPVTYYLRHTRHGVPYYTIERF